MTVSLAAAGPATGEVRLMRLAEPEELAQCDALYRRVFTTSPEDAGLNPRVLIAIADNGGIVVGALAEARLIGFAYSFVGRDADGGLYQYSQTAAVDPDWRGRGVGRALKLAQRRATLDQDIHVMRWLFDPLQVANARFNLGVLGGLGLGLRRNAYGAYGPPSDRSRPSDRLLVEWRLSSPRALVRAGESLEAAVRAEPAPGRSGPLRARASAPAGPIRAPDPGELQRDRGSALLGVPAHWPATGETGLRETVLDSIARLLDEGLVAVGCDRVDGDRAVYRFTTDPDQAPGG